MHIQASKGRRIEDWLRQDQAISRDHRDIGIELGKCPLFVLVPQRFRAPNLDTELMSTNFNRGRPLALAPPGRARRLGIGRDHLMPGVDQRIQRRYCKFRAAHQDDPQFATTPLALSLSKG
jgi:hypothetical protein